MILGLTMEFTLKFYGSLESKFFESMDFESEL